MWTPRMLALWLIRFECLCKLTRPTLFQGHVAVCMHLHIKRQTLITCGCVCVLVRAATNHKSHMHASVSNCDFQR